MSDQTPAIRVSGLVKTYGHVRALDGLDLEVRQGVVYGFLGPNGAGKTTTMRVLTGLIRSNAGTVELFGQPVRWLDRRPLFSVGALIESPAFYPYLSGRDNLRVLAGVGGDAEGGPGGGGPRARRPHRSRAMIGTRPIRSG